MNRVRVKLLSVLSGILALPALAVDVSKCPTSMKVLVANIEKRDSTALVNYTTKLTGDGYQVDQVSLDHFDQTFPKIMQAVVLDDTSNSRCHYTSVTGSPKTVAGPANVDMSISGLDTAPFLAFNYYFTTFSGKQVQYRITVSSSNPANPTYDFFGKQANITVNAVKKVLDGVDSKQILVGSGILSVIVINKTLPKFPDTGAIVDCGDSLSLKGMSEWIMDNESLTGDLADPGAKILIDWSMKVLAEDVIMNRDCSARKFLFSHLTSLMENVSLRFQNQNASVEKSYIEQFLKALDDAGDVRYQLIAISEI